MLTIAASLFASLTCDEVKSVYQHGECCNSTGTSSIGSCDNFAYDTVQTRSLTTQTINFVDEFDQGKIDEHEQKRTTQIIRLAKNMVDNLSSNLDNPNSPPLIRTFLSAMQLNADEKITSPSQRTKKRVVVKTGPKKALFKSPVDMYAWLSAASLVIAESLNQHVVAVPEDITVDTDQAELIMLNSVSFSVTALGETNNIYKYWPQIYRNSVADIMPFHWKDPLGVNTAMQKRKPEWQVWEKSDLWGNADSNKLEQDYDKGVFPFAAVLGQERDDDIAAFCIYGRNGMITMPDSEKMYLFGTYWRSYQYQREVNTPFLLMFKENPELALRLTLVEDANGVVFAQSKTNFTPWYAGGSRDYNKVPSFEMATPNMTGYDTSCGDTDAYTTNEACYFDPRASPYKWSPPDYCGNLDKYHFKLRPRTEIAHLYHHNDAEGVLNTTAVEEYTAAYIAQDEKGNADASIMVKFRSLEQYHSELADPGTKGKISVLKQEKTRGLTRIEHKALVPSTNWIDGPMKGINVVCMVKVVASVVPAMMFAALGATVIYVIDPTEILVSSFEVPLTITGRRLYLNLRESNDRAKMKTLLLKAHLFLTNLKTPSMERIGCGKDSEGKTVIDSATCGFDSKAMATQNMFGPKGGVYVELTAGGPTDRVKNIKGYADTVAQFNGLADFFHRSEGPTYEYAWTFYQDNLAGTAMTMAALNAYGAWKRYGGVWSSKTSLAQAGSFFAATMGEMATPVDWLDTKVGESPDMNSYVKTYKKSFPNVGIPGLRQMNANEALVTNGTIDWEMETIRLPFGTANDPYYFKGDIVFDKQSTLNFVDYATAIELLDKS